MGRYVNVIVGIILMKILLSIMPLGWVLFMAPVFLILMRGICFRYEPDSDSVRGVLLSILGAVIVVILN